MFIGVLYLRILMVGDIVGKPGRNILKSRLQDIKMENSVDVIIANAENSAGGVGITRNVANELYEIGVDVITMGNHVWDKKDIFEFISKENRIVRPANYPPDTPGNPYTYINVPNRGKLAVLNLSGLVFLSTLDCPFRTAKNYVEEIKQQTPYIFVDFHAEVTSEKQALAWYLDGQVSAVVGTHTHVQTADERILPSGTAYITDVGMTGPRDSILGVKIEPVIQRFTTHLPVKFEVAEGPTMINAVFIDLDEDGKAVNIRRFCEIYS